MRASKLFLLPVLAAGLALGTGVALTRTITCSPGGAACPGPDRNDYLQGTTGSDRISGYGGNDVLDGHGGADLLDGGSGDDIIEARERANHPPGRDTVRGGEDDDAIFADDGVGDAIDCGAGVDAVSFDAGLDTLANCERMFPSPVG